MKCKAHKSYPGINPPRRSKNYPDGCPDCWVVFREKKEAAMKELAPKRRQSSPKTLGATVKKAGTVKGKGFRVEKEPFTDEYVAYIGTRCLFVASDEEHMESFIMGFKEGARYAGSDE